MEGEIIIEKEMQSSLIRKMPSNKNETLRNQRTTNTWSEAILNQNPSLPILRLLRLLPTAHLGAMTSEVREDSILFQKQNLSSLNGRGVTVHVVTGCLRLED